MGPNSQIEYNDDIITALQWMWGDGFLSPGGPEEVAANLTAGCYFLDADASATCLMPRDAWCDGSPGEIETHRWAVVVLIDFAHGVESGSPGDAWMLGGQQAAADLRATEKFQQIKALEFDVD